MNIFFGCLERKIHIEKADFLQLRLSQMGDFFHYDFLKSLWVRSIKL